MNTFTIAHLSDIHFYESSDGTPTNHRHDLECLKGIERLLDAQNPDLLLITGDITNIGDKISCDRVYQWIHDRIYVDGEYYGLRATEKKLQTVVVPGNHDAFNASRHGANYKRWQSSLENFYSAFREYRFPDDTSVDYQFIRKGNTSIFLCRLDSCFLGDGDEVARSGSITLDKIAKGKVSESQSHYILKLYDEGIKGHLLDGSGSQIPSWEFLSSLKLLAMHHYLFEPAESKRQPLLHVKDRNRVFQNVAMSDFDAIICGHKHIGDIRLLAYSDHFDPRARVRLAMNFVRRRLGIHSLPMPQTPDGRLQAKMYRFLLSLLLITNSRSEITEGNSQRIIEILQRGLEDPKYLQNELIQYLKQQPQHSPIFDAKEIRELHDRIKDAFSRNEQKNLVRAALSLKGLIGKLAGRPFSHITAASSAKASERNTRNRAVGLYSIANDAAAGEYALSAQRFSWDGQSFSQPVRQIIGFPYARVESDMLDAD